MKNKFLFDPEDHFRSSLTFPQSISLCHRQQIWMKEWKTQLGSVWLTLKTLRVLNFPFFFVFFRIFHNDCCQ